MHQIAPTEGPVPDPPIHQCLDGLSIVLECSVAPEHPGELDLQATLRIERRDIVRQFHTLFRADELAAAPALLLDTAKHLFIDAVRLATQPTEDDLL